MMLKFCKASGGMLYVKGAPESILERCTSRLTATTGFSGRLDAPHFNTQLFIGFLSWGN